MKRLGAIGLVLLALAGCGASGAPEPRATGVTFGGTATIGVISGG